MTYSFGVFIQGVRGVSLLDGAYGVLVELGHDCRYLDGCDAEQMEVRRVRMVLQGRRGSLLMCERSGADEGQHEAEG